jgi:gamma-glutamyltranspeptidase/glutathione hydrolase
MTIAGYVGRLSQCLALALGATGCAPEAEVPGLVVPGETLVGIVAADEPRAAAVARDTLSAGGNGADAAVALYFALAVTMPSSAGLGGGGACVVHDPEERRTEALDFLPRMGPGGEALPGNARGMAALHARYGSLRWERLLVEAERLARFGTPIGRTLARELAIFGGDLLADPEARRIFGRDDGGPREEGERLEQPDLAGTLSLLRRSGAGAFHSGPLAASLVDGAQSVGVPLTLEALGGVHPELADTVWVAFGDHQVHFPPSEGGQLGALLLALLTEGEEYVDASEDVRPHLVIEAAARALGDRESWSVSSGASTEERLALVAPKRARALMSDYREEAATPVGSEASAGGEVPIASTGFVVADGEGLAVACEVTMNAPFGTGRMAPGTGVLLASAPGHAARSAAVLGPMIMANKFTGRFYYAGAGSGGFAAAATKTAVFLDAAGLERSVRSALYAKRLWPAGDAVLLEEGAGEDLAASLRRRGHTVETSSASFGRVNALWCAEGLPEHAETCQADVDPRGGGSALVQTK